MSMIKPFPLKEKKENKGYFAQLLMLLQLFAAFLLISSSACTISSSKTLRIRGSAIPPQISILEPREVQIDVNVENIGNETQKVIVSAEGSEGIEIESSSKNIFRLKPGEARIVTFIAKLTKDALPGVYKIELYAQTEKETARTSVEIKVNK